MSQIVQVDPWQKYKHKPYPVVPESGATGVIIMGVCIIFMILVKYKRK
jgi:hypothetical protein